MEAVADWAMECRPAAAGHAPALMGSSPLSKNLLPIPHWRAIPIVL